MKNAIVATVAILIACNSLAQPANPPGADREPNDKAGPVVLSIAWLEAVAEDFAAQNLSVDPALVPVSHHAETAPVNFAWTLEGVSPDDLGQSSFGRRVESRQYWVDVSGAELAEGVQLPLTSSGAVILVTPLVAGGNNDIDLTGVQLSVDGKRVDSVNSMMPVTDGLSLQRLGLTVPAQTVALELGKAIAPGQLDLSIARLPASRKFSVHVFEPASDWVAELALPRNTFVAGETVEFGFGLGDGQDTVWIDSVQAVLADPYADKTWELEVDKVGERLAGRAPADVFISGQDGLFEAYVYLETVHDGLIIRRDLKLPVSIVPPLARFSGRALATLDAGLTVEIGIETAVSGRFQINGQVFGTAPDGTLKPLAMVQSAAMIDGRAGSIELEVTEEMLNATGLEAPFEVRNLELVDQGRMFILQRRQKGILLTD